MKRVAKFASAGLLIAAGIVGLAISVFDLAGIDIFFKDPALIGLLIVGMLAVALGIERVTTLHRLEEAMDGVEEYFQRTARIRRIQGGPDIYKHGIRLVGETESHIRSVLVGNGNKAPRAFATAAATRLQQLKKARKPASMVVVLVLPRAEIPPDFEDIVRERHELYRRKGVGELVSVYVLEQDQAIGMDYLIVDRKHVAISFTPTGQTHDLMSSISIEDQPDIADQFANWFDNKLVRAARPII
jgi:hypothetical protein